MHRDAVARLPGDPVAGLVAPFGIGRRAAERMCAGKASMRPEMLERRGTTRRHERLGRQKRCDRSSETSGKGGRAIPSKRERKHFVRCS